jgi:hypothetical protein
MDLRQMARALAVVGDGKDDDEQPAENVVTFSTAAELRNREREREGGDKRLRVRAERLAEKLLKTDIEAAWELFAVLDWPDSRAVQVLHRALEQGLALTQGLDGADTTATLAQQIADRTEPQTS